MTLEEETKMNMDKLSAKLREMDTTYELHREYEAKRLQLSKEHADTLNVWAFEHHLDGDVIDTRTWKRGVLKITSSYRGVSIVFYPYKKNGELSKSGETHSGLSTKAFIPANSEDGEKHEI